MYMKVCTCKAESSWGLFFSVFRLKIGAHIDDLVVLSGLVTMRVASAMKLLNSRFKMLYTHKPLKPGLSKA